MRIGFHVLILTALCCAVRGTAFAQETAQTTVGLWIFDAQVRSFAPGIDAVISLSEEQKKQLADLYAEVMATNAVLLANMVLQDTRTSFAQRQVATATIQQAQAALRAGSRNVFTEAQRELVDRVYAAFSRVHQAAQQEMVRKVTAGFAEELGEILTAEQKQAMEKRQAELEEARAASEGAEADRPEQGSE
jgi:hypothetical protein